MSEAMWMMDSEFCCRCGAVLEPFYSSLCYDCQQDQWASEERDYYDGWESDWDIPLEEVNKPWST